jgi:3-methyladenine DNA glycosylase Tag
LDKLVLDYAEAMTLTPQEVPDELFARLHAELGEAGMVELTYLIAWENFRARANHAFGVEAAGFSEGAACALAHRATGHRAGVSGGDGTGASAH